MSLRYSGIPVMKSGVLSDGPLVERPIKTGGPDVIDACTDASATTVIAHETMI